MNKFMQTFIWLVSILLVVSLDSVVEAVVKEKSLEKKFSEALAYIKKSPLGKNQSQHCATIFQFVNASKKVTVEINNSRALKWMQSQKNNALVPILLCSYVAGNAAYQLEKKQKKDSPMAGAQMLMKAYTLLQSSDNNLKIAEIEILIKENKNNNLEIYLNGKSKDTDSNNKDLPKDY